MRIVQLLPELNEGGVERGVVELSRELVRRGHESFVVSAGGRLVEQIQQDGGEHFQYDVSSKNPLSVPGRVLGLRRLILDIGPDILHARSRVPAWLGYLANKKLHIPFVTTVHGFNSVNKYSQVMTFGDTVICVSGAIKDYVIEHYAVPNDKLVVIPRGIDLDRFNSENIDHDFSKKFSDQYNLTGKFVITTVGRITQLKDFETFIRAISGLRQKIPNIVGLIVGGVRADKKDYHEKLQQLVNELGAQEVIFFTGSQANVAEIYELSQVVVSSSKKPESFGRAAAEALAMNTPVVATGHGGILDIVIPEKTGALFRPEEFEELSAGIELCRQANFAGLRDFVVENFSLEKMVDQTESVYKALL